MARLLIALLIAAWIVAIAFIAVQNATPVVLQFLVLRSVEMPLGLVMAFSAALGIVATVLALPLLTGSDS